MVITIVLASSKKQEKRDEHKKQTHSIRLVGDRSDPAGRYWIWRLRSVSSVQLTGGNGHLPVNFGGAGRHCVIILPLFLSAADDAAGAGGGG